MDNEIGLELNFVMSNKVRGRIKRKHVSYFKLRQMNDAQYHAACDVIIAGMQVVGQTLIDMGYHMECQGKTITNDQVPDVNKH